MPTTPFVRFFSSVPGHIVSRYGTSTKGTANQRIGVRRTETSAPGSIAGSAELEWTDEIVAITAAEWALYSREYAGHVSDGALKERTEAEYLESIKPPPAVEEKPSARSASDGSAAGDASTPAPVDASAKTDPVPAAPESDT